MTALDPPEVGETVNVRDGDRWRLAVVVDTNAADGYRPAGFTAHPHIGDVLSDSLWWFAVQSSDWQRR